MGPVVRRTSQTVVCADGADAALSVRFNKGTTTTTGLVFSTLDPLRLRSRRKSETFLHRIKRNLTVVVRSTDRVSSMSIYLCTFSFSGFYVTIERLRERVTDYYRSSKERECTRLVFQSSIE